MLNKVEIMGRIVKDPVLNYTQLGVPVTSFTIAVDKDTRVNGSDDGTDFIDIVAWRNLAESVVRTLRQSSMVMVDGKLTVRNWVDAKGHKRRNCEVEAECIYSADTGRSVLYEKDYSIREELPE